MKTAKIDVESLPNFDFLTVVSWDIVFVQDFGDSFAVWSLILPVAQFLVSRCLWLDLDQSRGNNIVLSELSANNSLVKELDESPPADNAFRGPNGTP